MILLFLEQKQNRVITLTQILQGLLFSIRDKVLGLAVKNICNLTTIYTSGFCHRCLVIKSNSFATPWIVAHQDPLSMGFPRQKYWTGLPFASSGDLHDPDIEPPSPILAGGFFTIEPPGKAPFGFTSL